MAAAAAAPRPAAAAAPGSQARDEYDLKVRFFSEFLHYNRDEWDKKLNTALAKKGTEDLKSCRIPLTLNDLKKADPEGDLDSRILREPVKYLLPWEEALLAFLRETNPKALKELKQPLKLDISGAFGRNYLTPRGMNSGVLQNLVCIEGIVTKCGRIIPKLLQSMHVRKDKEDGHVEQRDHRDATAFVNQPNAGALPKADSENNELRLCIGLSVYKDYQEFFMQESPEDTPPGQVPKSIRVICEGELVDRAKPGERVNVIGVYRTMAGPIEEFTDGVFPARIIATAITPTKERLQTPFVLEDVQNIREIAARPDALDILARSFAPAICGHAKVKKGLLLQMIGGTEKNLSNGTHLRGDINVLLIGDPSCGKSQMLRFVMNTAPLAISTTGRGSSGVGLTAAMTREQGGRDFQLEAGAMVLADRGFICIDEFDKMNQGDRVAIHEAMEQQCVTISKAGMHVTLNARCSVVAAANPVHGSFNPALDLAKNIGMPDSLMSRFDLIFIVRDLTTEEIDRKIATQVLRQASYRPGNDVTMRRGVEQIHSSIKERKADAEKKTTEFEKTKVWEDIIPGADEAQKVLTVDFLRRYITRCRPLAPVMNERAQALVADKYVDMRMRFQSGFTDVSNPDSEQKPKLAVTTRTLEGLIRLATAHAKLKLRKDEVLEEDVEAAFKLMLEAREEEAPQPEPQEAGPDEGDDGADGAEDGPGGPGPSQGQKRKREDGAAAEEEPWEPSDMAIFPSRLTTMTTLVNRSFAGQGRQDMPKEELLENVNSLLSEVEAPFREAEFQAGLAKLEEMNRIMPDESGGVMMVA
jgi:DNA replication licensing factor MCM3